MHVGGDGVARGYHNRSGLTGERFIPDPFRDEVGARLYKTGDLARYLPDGRIQFLVSLLDRMGDEYFQIPADSVERFMADAIAGAGEEELQELVFDFFPSL